MSTASVRANHLDYLPDFGSPKFSINVTTAYMGGRHADRKNPYVSPLYGSWAGFPPILFQGGTVERLEDEISLAAYKAMSENTPCVYEKYYGMVHAFHLLQFLPETTMSAESVRKFMQHISGQHWDRFDLGIRQLNDIIYRTDFKLLAVAIKPPIAKEYGGPESDLRDATTREQILVSATEGASFVA